MMGIHKLVLIYHDTSNRVCRDIAVSVRRVSRLIHLVEKTANSRRNVVCLTECTDQVIFRQWVFLLLHHVLNDLRLPGRNRVLADIVPVLVPSKDAVRIQQVTMQFPVHIYAVLRGAGPVH